MIHQYKLNGYNIVLDTCSGSIHVEDVKEAGRERRYLVDNFALSFACKIYVQYAINK